MSYLNYKSLTGLLLAVYLVYCAQLYFVTSDNSHIPGVSLSDTGLKGREVWAKYNCQSCHQLFKLGGYLGPELTNIFDQHGKSEGYVLAFILNGSQGMPALGVSESEAQQLAVYLKEVGMADNAARRNLRSDEKE